jgi:hypothetical protein
MAESAVLRRKDVKDRYGFMVIKGEFEAGRSGLFEGADRGS